MVLAGKVNKSLVQLLGSHGGKAMGLCGLDGRMLMAEKLVTGADLGYVGEIKEVNPEPLNNALASGYIPIVSTVAGGYDGNVYNINADIAKHRRLPLKSAQKAHSYDRYRRTSP